MGIIVATGIGNDGCVSRHQVPGEGQRLHHVIMAGIDQAAYGVAHEQADGPVKGFQVSREYQIKGNGAIDILASRPGEKVAVEIETGKSNIKENLNKITGVGFDRIVFVATSPEAITKCKAAIESRSVEQAPAVELLNWLDVS